MERTYQRDEIQYQSLQKQKESNSRFMKQSQKDNEEKILSNLSLQNIEVPPTEIAARLFHRNKIKNAPNASEISKVLNSNNLKIKDELKEFYSKQQKLLSNELEMQIKEQRKIQKQHIY